MKRREHAPPVGPVERSQWCARWGWGEKLWPEWWSLKKKYNRIVPSPTQHLHHVVLFVCDARHNDGPFGHDLYRSDASHVVSPNGLSTRLERSSVTLPLPTRLWSNRNCFLFLTKTTCCPKMIFHSRQAMSKVSVCVLLLLWYISAPSPGLDRIDNMF
jgi:hypothetical protein